DSRTAAPHGAHRGSGYRRGSLRGAGVSAAAVEQDAAATPAADLILFTQGAGKTFGGLIAVDDVDFGIPRHGIVSIIGPNGAGKTTFFNMLTGLYKPDRGRVVFDGLDITAERPDIITKLGMARTFQNIRLFGTMTAV